MSEYQTVILDSLEITKTTQWIPVNIKKNRIKMLWCILCMWRVTSESFCFRHAYTGMSIYMTVMWKFTSALERSLKSLKTLQEIISGVPSSSEPGSLRQHSSPYISIYEQSAQSRVEKKVKGPSHYHEEELRYRLGTLPGGSVGSIAYSAKAREEGLQDL